VLALIAANSPISVYYDALLKIPVVVQVGRLEIAKPLLLWINDGLMAVFFFLIALELKRELMEGELNDPKKVYLPAFSKLLFGSTASTDSRTLALVLENIASLPRLGKRTRAEHQLGEQIAPHLEHRDARVRVQAARALRVVGGEAQGDLDLRLVEAAGLLHDIFKGHEDHAGRGAAWLEGNGFPEIAAIVAEHTDILWERGDQVDERALVYLADKILAGERILTLADRREAALKKYGQEEAARRNIAARFDTAAKIQTTVEKITGLSLIKILESSGK